MNLCPETIAEYNELLDNWKIRCMGLEDKLGAMEAALSGALDLAKHWEELAKLGYSDVIEKWMDSKGYSTIESFKGKLSKENSENNLPYHRSQYIDFTMTTSEIMKKYKVIN